MKSPARQPWERSLIDRKAGELRAVFARAGVDLAYVFGSLARGREADRKAISDLDIAVVFSSSTPEQKQKEEWYRLRADLEHVFGREDFDLVVANAAPAALRFRIMRDRDLIYCDSQADLVRFEAEARRDWNDMQYFRQIRRRALEDRYGVSED